MATTKKYLDEDGLVQYTGKVKKAINDASYTHGVTDIDGTTTAPSIDNTVNATANQRSATFTKDGSSDTFPYYDTTYGVAVAGSKDGLLSRTDKTKLDGIATGAEVNVQSDWNQTTTTADDYIKNKPAVNKVKQTSQNGADALPLLMSAQTSPTSGADYESGYDTALTFKPTEDELKVTNANGTVIISPSSGVSVTNDAGTTTIAGGGLVLPASAKPSISSTSATTSAAQQLSVTFGGQTSTAVELEKAASGKYGVVKVDTDLSTTSTNPVTNAKVTTTLNAKVDSAALSRVESGYEGAALVGYAMDEEMEDITVKDALDDIYQIIGGSGGGGDSIIDRVSALEDGDNLIQGTNVTLTKDTTNHTVTIAASDQKVAQTQDTSTAANIPLLLASGSTPTTAGAKYYPALSFRPSTGALVVSKVGSGGGLSLNNVTISEGEISLTDGNKTATISLQNNVFQFSGNSATATNATNDGSGNNIVNTYATKAALNELTNKWTGQFKIATAAEAAAIGQGDATSLELGYIYLVLDSGASSPNVYDEYIKVALGTSPETYSVEKIGTTDAGVDVVSLTPAEINTIWSTTAAAS